MNNVLSACFILIFVAWPGMVLAGPAYTLRDGQIYADGGRLGWEVYDTPAHSAAGRIKHWSFGSAPSDEDGSVAVFFDADGRSVGTIVFEGRARDLIWNPDGSRLALAYGSGARSDIFYMVYGANLEPESGELAGLADNLQWVDADRLVYVRIDGLRENGVFPGLSYGLKLSVVLYDCVARRELPLRTGTETANFYPASVSPDGRTIAVIEESVAAPEDWAVEDKINTRELEVPIPASKIW